MSNSAATSGHDELHRDWPVRAVALALAGAGIAVMLYFLLKGAKPYETTKDTGKLAAAAFLAVGGISFAFVVERAEQLLAIAFAVLTGIVVAGVVYWSGLDSAAHSGEGWRLLSALLAVTVAAPLFQAWRDARGEPGGIPYAAAHNRAWTDVILWFSAWAFVGIALGLAYLLAALFNLIGLKFLHDLLDKQWFVQMLVGLAFGGAVGLLRDRERILGTLQRVVTTVLSVLAPVLATGLIAFLGALPFTGLTPLWSATKSTTPILLSCIIGALILANAVIGDTSKDDARRRTLHWAAMILGLVMLPLGVLAAVSTGTRLREYGATPDRLWAVVFTGVACAYGLAYLIALVRHRVEWATAVRAANLRLAIGVCALAFVLSTPLLSFGAISTRDQLARLASGRTPSGKVDWSAIRFDFGPTGKAAVERQAKGGRTLQIRAAAAAALKADLRWEGQQNVERVESEQELDRRLFVLPRPMALPADLRSRLTEYDACGLRGTCAVIYTPGAREVFIAHNCGCSDAVDTDLVDSSSQNWAFDTARIIMRGNSWLDDDRIRPSKETSPSENKAMQSAQRVEFNRQLSAIRSSAVEIREVQRRQVFIGGKPVGSVFDESAP